MYQYKLEKNENGYDVIIYLNDDNEFAKEFGSDDDNKKENKLQSIYKSIKERYPNILINSIKVMIGGLLLATIPISKIDAHAQTTTNLNNTEQIINYTYTTKSGDSLWSIANQFNVSVNDLKQANKLTTDTLQIGEQLIIPTADLSTYNITTNYTVKSGDNLSTIALRYNVTVNQIMQVNNLKSDVLQIGTILKIPQTIQALQTSEVSNVTYTVKSGDNLSTIAQRYGVTVNQIKNANNLKSDVLQIGTVLEIPNTTQAPQTSEVSNVTYTVKSGDNLSTIAQRYNVTVNQIKTENNLKSDVLQIGTILKIPQATQTPTTSTPVVTNITHTVATGDTLWIIANRYNTSIDQLRSLNNLKSDVLQVGTVLKIPNAQTPTDNTQVVTNITHTVTSGENLWIIANRYNTTIDQLRSINNLKSDVLQIGTILKIPNTQVPNNTTPIVNNITHTVASGDTLWILANRYNTTIDQIRVTNNLTSDNLTIGQKLTIPQGINNNQTTTNRDVLYKVKSGDTIESIAKAYNISAQRLMQANNLSSKNIILNQSLIIPISNYEYPSTVSSTKYTVQSGDNLWSISKQFAVSVDSIRKASNLRSDNLTIGQQLIIPTTIEVTSYNRSTLEFLVEMQYNMNPTSVFHDVTVQNQEYWAKATKEQIRYYSNPENFADDEIQKYQFLVLNYNPNIQTTQINELLKNKGVFDGYGSTFNRAASTYNVSQVYLASHALLETGNGYSALSRGILVTEVDGVKVTPRVVYNMYGINAFDYSPNKTGAEYAYKQKWFTVEDAIIGGAKWISENYINNPTYQQNTLYKMRWNPASPGVHQYSTDVAWAYNQTYNIYNILSKYQNANNQFDIPKYNQYYKA